jgi:hypothetical protein
MDITEGDIRLRFVLFAVLLYLIFLFQAKNIPIIKIGISSAQVLGRETYFKSVVNLDPSL